MSLFFLSNPPLRLRSGGLEALFLSRGTAAGQEALAGSGTAFAK